MAITAIKRDQGVDVNIVRVVSTDTMATVAGEGYLTDQLDNTTALNNGPFQWLESDAVLVYASDGHAFYEFEDGDFSTLVAVAESNGDVTLPVTDGNFTVFDGTLGGLKDAGYSPSDATKTKVIMASSAVTVNDLLVAADTDGTLKPTTNVITATVNGGFTAKGAITSGAVGATGQVNLVATTASSGRLRLLVADNSANYDVTITNASHSLSATLTIPDGGQAASNFIISNNAGTQTIATGNIALTVGYIQQSAVNGLTAFSGGGQGSATALTRQINRVTTVAAGNDSVKLPAAVAGRVVTVINAAASNSMNCFPQSGETINALSPDAALGIAANKTVTFYCAVAGTWNSQVTA